MTPEEFEELIFLWKEYATEKEEKLTYDAILLKRETMYFVSSLHSLPINLANEMKEVKTKEVLEHFKQTCEEIETTVTDKKFVKMFNKTKVK